MEATEVFSKIMYLEEGMKKLLAQKAVSSEQIQQLLTAVEAKAQPAVKFEPEALAKHLAPLVAAKIPDLNAADVAKRIGFLLLAGLPTPDTVRQAGEQASAKINQEFVKQQNWTLNFVGYLKGEMLAVQDQVGKTVDQMPKSVRLDSRDKRILAIVLATPLLFLLALGIHSSFFRVSKQQYEQLQQQTALLQQQRTLLRQKHDRMTDAAIYYSNQINVYKRKFPKAAGYFRNYRPMPLAQPVKLVAR